MCHGFLGAFTFSGVYRRLAQGRAADRGLEACVWVFCFRDGRVRNQRCVCVCVCVGPCRCPATQVPAETDRVEIGAASHPRERQGSATRTRGLCLQTRRVKARPVLVSECVCVTPRWRRTWLTTEPFVHREAENGLDVCVCDSLPRHVLSGPGPTGKPVCVCVCVDVLQRVTFSDVRCVCVCSPDFTPRSRQTSLLFPVKSRALFRRCRHLPNKRCQARPRVWARAHGHVRVRTCVCVCSYGGRFSRSEAGRDARSAGCRPVAGIRPSFPPHLLNISPVSE